MDRGFRGSPCVEGGRNSGGTSVVERGRSYRPQMLEGGRQQGWRRVGGKNKREDSREVLGSNPVLLKSTRSW